MGFFLLKELENIQAWTFILFNLLFGESAKIEDILREALDSPAEGHFEVNETLERIRRDIIGLAVSRK